MSDEIWGTRCPDCGAFDYCGMLAPHEHTCPECGALFQARPPAAPAAAI